MPVLTVCIPTYNRREMLREAISSVQAQSFNDWKLLVSDNGSTGGTEAMVRDLAARDTRIHYHRFEKNRGPAANWSYLLTSAKTDLMALLPDDDLWLPDHLDVGIRALRSETRASLYCTWAQYFGYRTEGLHGPAWLAQARERVFVDSGQCSIRWLQQNPVATGAVIVRRSALVGCVLFEDDTFGSGDWFLWGQVALKGGMLVEPSPHVKYRWHSSNDSYEKLRGRRSMAQIRYVVRELATMALKLGVIDAARITAEVVGGWPPEHVATIVVALSSPGTVPELRRAARRIYAERVAPDPTFDTSMHCRIARHLGAWYLGVADIADRLIGRWWCPAGNRWVIGP